MLAQPTPSKKTPDLNKIGLPAAASTPSPASSASSSRTATPISRSASADGSGPAAKPPKGAQRVKIDIAQELAKRQTGQESLNLVVVGHVDAGKSTLMGHVLYRLGQVPDKTMKKYQRDSQKIGKGSFAYAWVLDETDEERER